jgi:hypothetical protein
VRALAVPPAEAARHVQQQPLAGPLHGGASLCGTDHPGYKHGRYSRVLPRGLRGAYERAASDAELLSLKDDIALIEARQCQLLRRLGDNPPPPYAEMLKVLDTLERSDDPAEREAGLAELREMLVSGRESARVEESVWSELSALIDQKTRTAKAEWRRTAELGGVVTVEQAMVFVKSLLAAARECVTDQGTLRRLNARVLDLLPPESTN